MKLHHRILAALLALIFIAPWSAGAPADSDQKQADQADSEPRHLAVHQLTVTPAAVGERPLRYELQTHPLDEIPGNAAGQYLVLNGLLTEKRNQEEGEWLDWLDDTEPADWLEQPDKLEKILEEFETAVDQAALVARYERLDLNYPERDRHVMHIMVEDPTRYWDAGLLLAARSAQRIADDDIDGAITDVRSQFGIARHLSQERLFIHSIAAAKVGRHGTQSLHRIIEHTDAPNLYWTLTDLPRPFIDIRATIRHESLMWLTLPKMRQAFAGEMSGEDWAELHEGYIKQMIDHHPWKDEQDREAFERKTRRAIQEARGYLAETPDVADNADGQMTDLEAMWTVAIHEFRKIEEEQRKLFSLPYYEAAPGFKALSERMDRTEGRVTAGWPLTEQILALDLAYWMTTQLDRHIAMLRTIEAIRMHAAEAGELPDALTEIDAVPVPDNPLTGEPFEYTRDGDAFILHGRDAEPAGELLRFEVTVEFDRP